MDWASANKYSQPIMALVSVVMAIPARITAVLIPRNRTDKRYINQVEKSAPVKHATGNV